MSTSLKQHLKLASASDGAEQRRGHLAAAETRATRPSDWAKVAAHYAVLLGEAVSVRRCLEAGSNAAQDIRGKLQIAEGYADIAGDTGAARALLLDAERQLTSDAVQPNTTTMKHWRRVSRIYLRALEDPIEAKRCLDEALNKANGLQSCLEIASAWRDWAGHSDEIERCFEKASEFTETTQDLITLADEFHDLGLDRQHIRNCLESAYRLARQELSDIEAGYRDWLNDPEAADRAALPPVSPEVFVSRCRVMTGWSSSAGGLLSFLAQRVDQASLQSIAGADHGCNEQHNYVLLSRIRETGLIPDPFPWRLAGVLELTRWGDGPHLGRAFACVLLCLREAHPHADCWDDSAQQTVAVLIESCLELGAEAMSHLEGFLVAVAEGHPGEDTSAVPFVLFGLLLAAAWRDESDPRLPALANQIIEREKTCHDRHGRYAQPQHGWLLGLTFQTIRHDLWRALAHRILGPASEPHLRALLARLDHQ